MCTNNHLFTDRPRNAAASRWNSGLSSAFNRPMIWVYVCLFSWILWVTNVCMHIYMYIHAHGHIPINMYADEHIHCMSARSLRVTSVHIYTHVYIYTYAHTHNYIHIWIHIHRTSVRSLCKTWIYLNIRIYICTHIYIYTCINMYTYKYIYVHTCAEFVWNLGVAILLTQICVYT